MGYWVAVWVALTLEEAHLFRSGGAAGRGWDWDDWDRSDRLPVGAAALLAFLGGWAGAVLCMDQVWYVGPIARLVGADGADVSVPVALVAVCCLLFAVAVRCLFSFLWDLGRDFGELG